MGVFLPCRCPPLPTPPPHPLDPILVTSTAECWGSGLKPAMELRANRPQGCLIGWKQLAQALHHSEPCLTSAGSSEIENRGEKLLFEFIRANTELFCHFRAWRWVLGFLHPLTPLPGLFPTLFNIPSVHKCSLPSLLSFHNPSPSSTSLTHSPSSLHSVLSIMNVLWCSAAHLSGHQRAESVCVGTVCVVMHVCQLTKHSSAHRSIFCTKCACAHTHTHFHALYSCVSADYWLPYTGVRALWSSHFRQNFKGRVQTFSQLHVWTLLGVLRKEWM